MSFYFRQVFRASLICTLFIGFGASAPAPKPTDNAVSALLQEVRLRKIHIVRPDLIPYPISYEVDC